MVLCRAECWSKPQPVAYRLTQTKAEGKGIPIAGFCSLPRDFAGCENTAESACIAFPLGIAHGDPKAEKVIAFPPYICRQYSDADPGGEGDSRGKARENKEMGDPFGSYAGRATHS